MGHQPGQQGGTAPQQYSLDGRWWWNSQIWVPASQAPQQQEARLAPHSLRLLAFVLDVLCVAVIAVLLVLLGKLAAIGSLPLFVLIVAVGFVAYTSMALWLSDGQTIGKAVCGLMLFRIGGAAPSRTLRGLVWAVGRQSVGYFVVDVFGLGVLVALMNGRRRCLHDYAFKSEVLRCPTIGDQSLESASARLRAFKDRVEAARTEANWASYLARWLVKLVLYPAIAILFLLDKLPAASPLGRLRDSITQLIQQTGGNAPPAASVPTGPAPSPLGLWVGTSVATGAVVVVAGGAVLARSIVGIWDGVIEIRQNGPDSFVGVTARPVTNGGCHTAVGTEVFRIQGLPPHYIGSELWTDRRTCSKHLWGATTFDLKDQNTLIDCTADPFPGSSDKQCSTRHRTG